ncbi:hypothetical protein GOP47_0006652 [Adiantum capillus-veneris]|uniref:Uncharacterized protein n=1 Tax=Adiantum capillus-veneris TaxID=13818 RepID=A0A9D4V414_ADICA|nr:hypothetical protein GOP47_0006652 [Adiantum capillus-veneris]
MEALKIVEMQMEMEATMIDKHDNNEDKSFLAIPLWGKSCNKYIPRVHTPDRKLLEHLRRATCPKCKHSLQDESIGECICGHTFFASVENSLKLSNIALLAHIPQ